MPAKAEIYAWYAGCVLLGIPWWILPDISLGLYAFVYFWTWAVFLLATYRLGWGFHRLAGIVLALALTFGIWLAILLYAARYGDDPEFASKRLPACPTDQAVLLEAGLS